jgi:hypothetical protein
VIKICRVWSRCLVTVYLPAAPTRGAETRSFPVNDDHPPADIKDGQDLVLAVYDALAGGPQWDRSLLVIVYDENGGFYDHVPPPQAADEGMGTQRTRHDGRAYGARRGGGTAVHEYGRNWLSAGFLVLGRAVSPLYFHQAGSADQP